ncbi:MAG TPA: glycosyltransferase family 1 protein [Aggregatilineales bacterium]|nr:glycosyltransferase family 1 protein [Aggregatilineales bacterium]
MREHRLVKSLRQFNLSDVSRIFGEDYRFTFDADALAPIHKVAIFAESFFPRFDGVAQTAYITLRYLQETGREVLVFAGDTAPTHIGASRVVPLPSVGVRPVPDFRVGLPVNAVARNLRTFQPDIIHMFAPFLFSLRGIYFGRKGHIPLIGNYQTDLPRYLRYYRAGYLQRPVRRYFRYVHNHCDLTLVPSRFTLKQLDRLRYRRLNYWQHGVNDQRFNPAHRTAEWRARLLNGRDPSSLLCIFVGRLASEKNIEALVGVAHLPGVALTIIGDGPKAEHLRRRFAGTGTYFTGALFGHDLARAYASADVFVFPSLTETFGLVVLEAMASGLPAVVRSYGGVTDLITEGETGWICENNVALMAGVARLRDHPDLRLAMAQRVRQEAEERTWNGVMAELERYYLAALASLPR